MLSTAAEILLHDKRYHEANTGHQEEFDSTPLSGTAIEYRIVWWMLPSPLVLRDLGDPRLAGLGLITRLSSPCMFPRWHVPREMNFKAHDGRHVQAGVQVVDTE